MPESLPPHDDRGAGLGALSGLIGAMIAASLIWNKPQATPTVMN